MCLFMISNMMLTRVFSVSDVTRSPIPEGKKVADQVLRLLTQHRQVPFLISKEVLERCSVWGKFCVSLYLLLLGV